MKKTIASLATTGTALLLTAQAYASDLNILPSDDQIRAGGDLEVSDLIASLINGAILISAIAVLMYLILGGFQWLTSGGDKGKTEQARNRITSALIGLLIVVASWAIWQVVLRFLNIDPNDLAEGFLGN